MESGDWRAQLQRERTVNKIMDMLKMHLPFSRYERLQELEKIAERVEKEIYTVITCQSEYTRKICFMMLSMETRLQVPVSDSIKSNSAAISVNRFVSLDSTAQTGNPNGGDWQEQVYQKIKTMKNLYQLDLESGDWKVRVQADSRQRIVNKIMDTLKRCLPFSGHEELQDIAVWLEEKAYNAATTRYDYLRKISLKMLKMETRFQDYMSDPMQSNFAANTVNPSVPLDLIAQTANPTGVDWQEVVYQKIKAMKDLYLLDLNNIQQKLLSKLLQHESLPQQLRNEQHEKLKTFKNMLERFMQFLQIPKHAILASYKDKLGTYEMQILKVINLYRQKPATPQLQALSPSHARSLQQSLQIHPQSAQNVINMQKRLCPQKRAMPEASSRSFDSESQTSDPDGGEWQAEVCQKIKTMKDMYPLDLKPTQGASGAFGDPTMESSDWRAQLQADSRRRIVNKIMDILKKHLPFSGDEGLQELNKIAVKFEEKIYTAATSQPDYLRKISLKLLTMENRSQNPMSDPMQSNSTANGVNPSDPGSQVMQQVNNQGQQLPRPIQGASSVVGGPTMEFGDWRAQVQADSRERIKKKIMDTLKRHLPLSTHEGLQALEKIAVKFEERIYTDATSQCDYLRKISSKMVSMETRFPIPDPMQSNSAAPQNKMNFIQVML